MNLSSISDLIRFPPPARPAPDGALVDLVALEDTQVLDVHVDVVRSRAGVLLEARQSAAVPGGNLAVLIGYGLREVRWSRQIETTPVHAFSVVGGGVQQLGSDMAMTLACDPQSDLVVAARAISLHFVFVSGLPPAPVDYGSDDADIRRGTPSWHHSGQVLKSWSVEAPPMRGA